MRPPLLLVAAFLGTAIGLSDYWQFISRSLEHSAPIKGAAATLPAEALYAPPAIEAPNSFDQVWTRPHFTSNRQTARPPEPADEPAVVRDPIPAELSPKVLPEPQALQTLAPEVVVKPPPQRPEFRLAGLRNQGDKLEVLIQRFEGGKEEWLSEGRVIGGWKIEKISPEGLLLTAGKHEFSVSFY